MGFIEKRNVARPETGEAPFNPGETFFSHTDERGIIRSGNFIFQRVAGYEWEELLGAPHKIIRHPDMPSGLFWLFWDTLKKGRPIGAYVKNRAKDGLHYWVYAVAMPAREGFLSVRIKPCSELLAKVKEKYLELREAENEKGISPEESAARLLEWVGELGYSDYMAFASHALSRELQTLDQMLENPPDGKISEFEVMIRSAEAVVRETGALSTGFEAISTIPTNMRIIASRLEPSGGAITALSQNYWAMSEEMSNWFRSFVSDSGSDFAALEGILEECRFMTCTARILSETAAQFARERRRLGNVDVVREQARIKELTSQYIRRSEKGLKRISEVAQRISDAVTIMRRYALGLSSTRVMCNIESARLPAGGETLANIIEQLGEFQHTIDQQLGRIDDLSRDIHLRASTLG